MSGETKTMISGWTVDTVRGHFDSVLHERDIRYEQRFLAQDVRYEQRFLAQENAIKTALTNVDRMADISQHHLDAWKAGANEWRDAMNDRERNFTSKEENMAISERFSAEMQSLKERMDKQEGAREGALAVKQSAHGNWTLIMSLIGIIAGLAGAFLGALFNSPVGR